MRFKRFAKPLSQIFGAPARKPAQPVDPIAALDSASPQRLTAIAAADGEHEVRAAAIGNLKDVETLRRLAGLCADASPDIPMSLERIAQQRLAQLIDAGTVEFKELCAAGANIPALLAVAGHSSDPEHLASALASIDEPGQLADLAAEGGSSRIRQLAAQRISDPDELKALIRRLRGKDKSVYKIIKEKCAALRAEQQRLVQIQSDLVAACESLERHSHRIYDVIYEPSFRHFHSRWQALESQAPPEIGERAARAVDRCREIIAEHLEQLARRAAEESDRVARQAAREQAAALAEVESRNRSEAASLAAAEAAARHEAEERRRADESAAQAAALRQIGGLIGKVHDALREGNTGRASGLRRAVEEKLSALPAVPSHLAKQVLKLDGTLDDLKQWKEHAAAPKRAELIEEMEALVGSQEKPEALAQRIKQLQDDWKTVSKGIVSDSEADWQRFHQASIAAYQPCRDFFEARAKLWEANLEKRRGVMDRLRAFEAAQSGDVPDWRTIAAVLREAPQEWRRHSPVERAAGRALQEEFDAAMDRLQGKLDAWHAHNEEAKQSLIQLAQQLAAKEDSRETVDAVKRLQMRWKDVGPARRDQEQALWTAFRAQCDAIFQKRQQAHADHAAALEANKARAAELCEEIERTAGLTGPALLEGSSTLREWRSAFEGLGELPRGDRRSLEDRFERALRRVQAAVSQWRLSEKRQSIADLFEAGRRVHAYGWATAQGAAAEDCDALKRAAEASITAVRQWPKGGADALREALAKAETEAASLDAAAHERALRLLCIRGEILADRSTPPEDLALRRSYQMERLVQRMGQGSATRPDGPEALALEWIRVGPVSAQTHQALLERFLSSHFQPVSGTGDQGVEHRH
jgi:hypothetical protein